MTPRKPLPKIDNFRNIKDTPEVVFYNKVVWVSLYVSNNKRSDFYIEMTGPSRKTAQAAINAWNKLIGDLCK